MSDIEGFALFVLAGISLNLTPGADMLFIINRATSFGLRNGIAAALGIATGILVHLVLAVAGVSALIAASPSAINALQIAGAVYLMWLGYTLIFSGQVVKVPEGVDPHDPDSRLIRDFSQGVIVNVLNPKIALFFLAFIPQFINPLATHPVVAMVILGLTFNVVGAVVNIGVAALASRVSESLTTHETFFNWLPRVIGVAIILLGARLILTSIMG